MNRAYIIGLKQVAARRIQLALIAAALLLVLPQLSRGQTTDADGHADAHSHSDARSAASATSPSSSPATVHSVVLQLLEEAEVPAQEAGVIVQVAVREGDVVQRGQVLAQLDDRVARLEMTSAELEHRIALEKLENDVDLRYSEKALEVAEAELRRSTESIAAFPRSVSQSQIDVERLTVERTRLEREQAQKQKETERLEADQKAQEMEAARLQVARRQIVAPIDGVVVEVFARTGEWVEPGERTLRIVNLARLKAEGFIAAPAAGTALQGAAVAVASDSPDVSAVAGRIVFVSPEIDPITGEVRIWAEVDNRRGELRPGERVRMRLVAGTAAETARSQ